MKEAGHNSRRRSKGSSHRRPEPRYVLQLYVTGRQQRSRAAVSALRAICATYLPEGCHLEVIDVSRRPALARDEQIVALPMLIRRRPLPARRLVGDLSDKERVLLHLDLRRRQET
jgi:circadian clock protein KaiB